ncbi:MAG: DUF4388 domain-containing protein [Calothrix sp. FI2-JRJ7]|jgi:hypothetical protein|nr:DUF4388 domain-containing protein [Calothrix sp. FI2-JRJ7]
MSLSSSFTDFSLAELFQLIDQGKKSGCLTVCTLPNLKVIGSKSQHYYIWFRQGNVVAATSKLNGLGLVEKIVQRGWVNERTLKRLRLQAATDTPLGLYLKTLEILSAEQLNLLFASQLQQVRQLFEIQKGVFKLDSKAILPTSEMTGISLRATEVALMALRVIKNWAALADALPNATSAIEGITLAKTQLHLHPLEWQLWEFADGFVSLNTLASQLNQPIATIQQVAFRLMVAGLVEEIPLSSHSQSFDGYMSTYSPQKSQPLKVSTSFLQNLVGFLKSKA